MSGVAAYVLALVFAAAAGAKLRARPDMAALGLPASTAVVVAIVEIALAFALVLWPAEAGIAALALLAGFTAFLARRLGSETGCGCFGSTTVSAVRPRDLARNGVLLLLAAVAAFA